MRFVVLGILFILCKGSFQATLRENADFYIGGFAEIAYATTSNDAEATEKNLNTYLALLAGVNGTDILVFPEATLNRYNTTTYVPHPKDLVQLCNSTADVSKYEDFLIKLSCEAQRLRTYLVINLIEKEECQSITIDPRPCSPNGQNIFNTNVVFDRSGVIISRYRKVHLYEEPKNTTYVPEYGVFDTDFGVKFGHFICFDILFYTPTQNLVLEHGIKNFLFPTMWFSQLPFLTGVQFQEAWAYGNDVNLIAAGASNPSVGSTGSGIYNGRNGPIVTISNNITGKSEMRICEIPKNTQSGSSQQNVKCYSTEIANANPSPDEKRSLSQEDILLKRDYLEFYATKLIDLTQGTKLTEQFCFNKTGFCCDFDLEWSNHAALPPNSKYYKYRLAVFDGWRKEQAAEMNKLKNCALIACIGDSLEDCGQLFPSSDIPNVQPQVQFSRIGISGVFPQSTEYLIMPNTVKDDLLPLDPHSISWKNVLENDEHYVSMQLDDGVDNLLTFAIYANYYNGTERSSASVFYSSSLLLTLFVTFNLFK